MFSGCPVLIFGERRGLRFPMASYFPINQKWKTRNIQRFSYRCPPIIFPMMFPNLPKIFPSFPHAKSARLSGFTNHRLTEGPRKVQVLNARVVLLGSATKIWRKMWRMDGEITQATWQNIGEKSWRNEIHVVPHPPGV